MSLSPEHHDLDAIAREHGTPFYLYDLDLARAHIRALREHLPANVDVLYAMKANANRAVLAGLKSVVSGLDISSGGEIGLAELGGYSPSVMSFAGPGKTDQELERAIASGLHLLSVESVHELLRADAIAKRLGKKQHITVRINPLHTAKEFAMRMGGGPSQFGIPEEDIGPAIAAAKSATSLVLSGLHIYAGTQCLDAAILVENLKQTVAIATRVAKEHAVPLDFLNLGGGFGIPYFAGQSAIDTPSLSRAVGAAITDAATQEPLLAKTRFILELGRFLIGAFGLYVARVVDVKETRQKRLVVLDGGMNHCFPATGMFGQLIKKNYPVRNVSHPGAPLIAQEIVGPLCTPMDSMARAVELPTARVGDLVAFLNVGAYSFSASPLLFLGHDTPLELVSLDGKLSVGRTRKSATMLA